jgi:tetratricopeptide (TPR) repeat protein
MGFARTILIFAMLMAGATAANASFSGDKPDKSSTPSTSAEIPPDQMTPRQQAERSYGEAYDEVAKAKKDLAAGKTKNAEKKFKKALGRGMEACEYDTTYHEAWNLVGYSARKLGKYDQAITAYTTCLRQQPSYAPAREYLGEAYLDLGKPDLAHQQLSYLERLEAPEETASLKAAIEAWEKANPAKAGNGTPEGSAASADSASTGGK